MKKTVMLVLLAIAFTGCAKDFTKASSTEILGAAKSKSSEFDSDNFTYLPSLYATLDRGFLGGTDRIEYAMGVSRPKDGSETTQGVMINIRYFDTEWRFYELADFAGGVPAEVKIHNRNVSGCSTYNYLEPRCNYSEAITIKLSRDFIKSHPAGFSVRLNSKQGKQNVIAISENYMNAFAELLNKQ